MFFALSGSQRPDTSMLSRLIRCCSTSTNITPRSALVTGGARGLGEAIARRLTDDGYAVYIADLEEEVGIALANEIGASYVYCNVRDPQSVRSASPRCSQSYQRSKDC